MAYDEGLAERIRGALDEVAGVTEKRMFGGIAFLVRGSMAVGIVQDKLMIRVGPESYDALLRERHVRKMDFTGRPMKGFVYILAAGYESDADLARWVARGVEHVLSLPAKSTKAARKRSATSTKRPKARRAPAERTRSRK